MLSMFSRGISLLLLVGVNLGPAANLAFASSGPAFSGQATAIKATVLSLPPITLADTGPLPSSGGAQEASSLSANQAGIGAEVLHASTIGQGDRSRSEASVANLTVNDAGQSVAADFLMSQAMAQCANGSATASGSSEVAGLTINGQPIVVSGSPNQTVILPGGLGEVIINEQTTGPGSITVNALHVIVTGVADVVVASSHADISNCPTPPGQIACNGGDFVTGGGWIDTSGRDTFAVAGGIKNGSFWGHLEYQDHSKDVKVHGTGVTAYSATGPNSRHIEGSAEVNGQSGFAYKVDVTDNGSPGRNDTFSIQLSNGYTASGTLGGGNIQLHQPCS